MHWGKELLPRPLPYQLQIAKHFVSLGVQVVIGSHRHFLQSHCIHNNTIIAWSLGNFFPPYRLLSGNDAVSEVPCQVEDSIGAIFTTSRIYSFAFPPLRDSALVSISSNMQFYEAKSNPRCHNLFFYY